MSIVEEALEALRRGKPVLVYDWPERESEVDMIFYAGNLRAEDIYKLRREAGGLICYGTSRKIIELLRLPLFTELLEKWGLGFLSKTPNYGSKSNLVLWVNSIKVRTGISDSDRALTVGTLHRVVEAALSRNLESALSIVKEELYSPGHVPILAADDIEQRRGHTELAVTLASEAGLLPSVVYAEMLSFGRSMSLEEAKRYADSEGLVLVTGEEIFNYIRRSRR